MRKAPDDDPAGKVRPPRSDVKLSPAEAAVVAQLLLGLRNHEIAEVLGKSVGTVKNQLVGVYRKFGVSSRMRLMAALR